METLIYSYQHQSLRLYMLIFRGLLALPLAGERFNQGFLIILLLIVIYVKSPGRIN